MGVGAEDGRVRGIRGTKIDVVCCLTRHFHGMQGDGGPETKVINETDLKTKGKTESGKPSSQ